MTEHTEQMKVFSRIARWGAVLAGIAGLLLLPPAWRLRGRERAALDGVLTLDDAAAACRRTGLTGWALVAAAQQLVARKFTHYTLRNLWDTPGRAFEYGMGYCTQYNLALKGVLDRLGIPSQPVLARRIASERNPDWNMGHTWLRVTLGAETRDVCAGSTTILPGQVDFRPVGQVWRGNDLILALTHVGMVLFVGGLEWYYLLARRTPPHWMYYKK